jgi:ribosomal protein S21
MFKKGRRDEEPAVQAKFLEVKIEETSGDTTKLIKRFMRKVRKEEVLKPYYGRLMFYKSKSQKRREKKSKAVFEQKKLQSELDE